LLGHKNIETTENYYISSTSETRQNATEIFDKTTQSEIINEIINFDF
jgi:integrase